ncbi:MAG: hypothetical protein KJ856_06655 [Gammaproteobacteria bacterium]|nr:hypothetical protein [Gammaproteobacteria bacterium]MBU1477982.1 hypothetical protein [Gammaproteobacteria bacterium]MBU2000880.1 hypothetical protein [Gammaproteobacteria bacterium]MBU2132951.1 hypothetical protein [Gammaproteobacteria bacterium]MBU2186695.1 hypothetical protein [Gammaproteobacteria bacterium]
MIIEAFSAIVDAARFWKEKNNETAEELRNKRDALQLVMNAVIATKAYLYDLDQGTEPSRIQEKELARKWSYASMAISEYDYQLYMSAQLKALGWADPREWKRAELRPWVIKLDVIIEQCQHILGKG